ncbi:hypothetical protein NE237_011267 [Protea cynaroides]|uniref:UDP-glycosyltransferase n=1 Tax=Protea cynaroides TaxID=273540 RepID=A0A9Q0JVN3_9MAGN|nr:hypothetical protein NE237_011267 [Protea cynaroides]
MHSCEYRDIHESVKLPRCVPLYGRDFMDPIQDKQIKVYTWTLYHSKRFRLADGILLNSFMDMEAGAIKALKEGGDSSVPPIYSVGPLIQNALGLELSEQRFLWVVKSPNTTYLGAQAIEEEDPLMFLPNGFLERTKGRGLVVHSWAPQIQVLSHASTGGFLTPCGWNSTLKSVVHGVHGVPLIAWPLFAEQKMNAMMLVEDLKVALRPKVEKKGIVRRMEISRVVKCLMEGDEGKRA